MQTMAGSTRQAALELGVHEQTVRKLVREGKLGAVRVGRRIVIPRSAIERFLEECSTNGDR